MQEPGTGAAAARKPQGENTSASAPEDRQPLVGQQDTRRNWQKAKDAVAYTLYVANAPLAFYAKHEPKVLAALVFPALVQLNLGMSGLGGSAVAETSNTVKEALGGRVMVNTVIAAGVGFLHAVSQNSANYRKKYDEQHPTVAEAERPLNP